MEKRTIIGNFPVRNVTVITRPVLNFDRGSYLTSLTSTSDFYDLRGRAKLLRHLWVGGLRNSYGLKPSSRFDELRIGKAYSLRTG